MNLTGSPTEEDINRVALAFLNGAFPVGNMELVDSIESTPRFNIGKTFEYQDRYDFLVKHTTLLDACISPGSPSHWNYTIALQPTASSGTPYDVEAGYDRSYLSYTERPLGKKAAKRRKSSLETLAQSEVASSVRNLTECTQESNSLHARNQSEKLRLHDESNRLRIYETMFLHESSTASQEERAFAESKMRTLFLEILENRPGRTADATAAHPSVSLTHALSQPSQADDYADPSAEHEGMLGETDKEGPTKSQRIQSEYNNAPHVRVYTELTESRIDDSEIDI
jgi:hypothetical protein